MTAGRLKLREVVCEVRRLSEQLESARAEAERLRAENRTLKAYIADRDEQLRRYEVGAAWTKSRTTPTPHEGE